MRKLRKEGAPETESVSVVWTGRQSPALWWDAVWCKQEGRGQRLLLCPFVPDHGDWHFFPHLLGKGRPSWPVGWWLPLVISKPVGMTSSREHRVRSVYVFWNRWCVPVSWNQRGVGWEKWHLSVFQAPGTQLLGIHPGIVSAHLSQWTFKYFHVFYWNGIMLFTLFCTFFFFNLNISQKSFC